ncbi:MAG: hypothetical protein K0S18_363 [Anaerocolumna sp.]|nr:hypothetical protein [Anaerocolumna sp.]
MQEIYYLNHINQKINLLESPYRLQTGDFFSYSWTYESTNNTGRYGSKITRFNRAITEKNFDISIMSKTKELYYSALNHFLEVTETDVLNKKPGKLYIGEQYISCYLISSVKAKWESGNNFLENKVKLVSEYPFWITESNYNFLKPVSLSGDNKRYPHRYTYRYVAGLNEKTILNNHFAPSDMRIVIYGPVLNPFIIIGNNTYAINIELLDAEYLILDTSSKTIRKIMNDGTEINAFNNRVKIYDVFAKISTGSQSISWNGNFMFDVTIFEERSEPKWSL